MAAALFQALKETISVSTSPASTTGTITTTTGSLFLVVVRMFSGVMTAVTDSKSNTYGIVQQVQNTTDGDYLEVWKCENGTGGAGHKPTVTAPFGTTAFVELIEVTGAATASAIDVSASVFDQASPFGVDVTTTNPNVLVIGMYGNTVGSDPVTFTAGGSFTLDTNATSTDNSANFSVGVATRHVSATGTYNPAFTVGSGSRGPAVTLAIKDSGGGAAVPSQGQDHRAQTFTFMGRR
jgi:hypothetical protein